ncbi:uncharacterized protein LOC117171936 isoform X3 [Belonocnema kinseyi]|uniref:uncharacterized protein LOC117171936 isoform X3 n=1 Tax=Belonocnema kinseyi TaxID=2817044 RepID=UPI00143DBC5A|nr:uncharacterized protein LOC117171936 isoform X3 [Belonocnema kinseyi]
MRGSSSIYNVFDQFSDFVKGIICWFWDTLELFMDILLEFFTRTLELIIVLMNLIFQVVCFFRDLCIEAMHTFANVFQGIVNVIGSITCDDVEDFASACIVVLLWIGAVKIIFSIFNKKSGFNSFNPYAITDPMTGMVPGSNVGIKLEESCAPRRGARRRGMPRRRGRRRFNSPCQ